jgi:predicted phosphodiesterase
VGAARLLVIHDLKEIEANPAAADVHAVISGHSHMPCIERRGGVLYLNPGSAGPRRFKLPIAVARLRVRGEKLSARLIEIC